MKLKDSKKTDNLFDAVNVSLVVMITIIILYPLMFVIFASISDTRLIYSSPFLLWPKGMNFESYIKVLENMDIWRGYKNTVLYTLAGTGVNIVLTAFGAYPLSRKDFYGKNLFTFIFTFTLFFSGGLIPTYMVVQKLGMTNHIWSLIIPGAVNVYNMIIMRTYFQTNIASELQESASIDGCGNIRLFFKIVLPLSIPIIAVMVLFYGVGHWNSYFSALIYLSDRLKYPLQLVLREILIQSEMNSMLTIVADSDYSKRMVAREGLKYSVIVLSSLPMLILFPFLQKFFEKGIMVGALKG